MLDLDNTYYSLKMQNLKNQIVLFERVDFYQNCRTPASAARLFASAECEGVGNFFIQWSRAPEMAYL
jgi:hypothetical protein